MCADGFKAHTSEKTEFQHWHLPRATPKRENIDQVTSTSWCLCVAPMCLVHQLVTEVGIFKIKIILGHVITQVQVCSREIDHHRGMPVGIQ